MAKKRFSKSNVLWFIRSRSYTPVADLRRRFRLESEEVTILPEPTGKIYIGLPEREANMIHQLWQEGKIGLECLPKMNVRVVEGVYPLPMARKEEEELSAEAAEVGAEAEGLELEESETDEEGPAEGPAEMAADDYTCEDARVV